MVKNIKRYQRDLHKDTADQERRVPEMVNRWPCMGIQMKECVIDAHPAAGTSDLHSPCRLQSVR